MTVSSLQHPLLDALGLLMRWPSLAAVAVLFVEYNARRVVWTPLLDGSDDPSIAVVLAPFMASFLVNGAVIFLLARTLLRERDAESPLFLAKWFGLYVLYELAVHAAGWVATPLANSTGYSLEIVRLLIGVARLAGIIVLFPMAVRIFVLAAGFAEPALGNVWSRALGEQRSIYTWYVVALVAFGLLFYGTSTLLGPPDGRADSDVGSVVRGGIYAISQVFRDLLTIVVALRLVPTGKWQAQVFR